MSGGVVKWLRSGWMGDREGTWKRYVVNGEKGRGCIIWTNPGEIFGDIHLREVFY